MMLFQRSLFVLIALSATTYLESRSRLLALLALFPS
jgi:hypothetical protein